MATIPLEPIVTLSFSAGSAGITWTMVFVGLGAANAVISYFVKGRYSEKGDPIRSLFVAAPAAIALLTPAMIYSTAGAAGVLAFLNFVVGVLAGVLVGTAWARSPLHRFNIIDAGVFLFVLGTMVQLGAAFAGAGSFAQLHQNSQVPWGNSNYVAGVMVVTSMLLVGRAQLLRSWRIFHYLIAVVGVSAAVLTLSRGGAIAFAAGLAAILWFIPRRRASKFFTRLVALGLPFGAVQIVAAIESQRATVNSQVYRNVDTRFELWGDAWQSFLQHPIFGTGWAGFRQITTTSSEEHTFAHNFILSFLQIGGLLFGVAVILIFITLGVKAGRAWAPVIPTLVSAFAIAMTDPFLEGTVGGMMVWAALAFTFALPKNLRPDNTLNRAGLGSASFGRMDHAASVSAGAPAACAQDARGVDA